jgi:tetratricopeptide (TPR) repeat protein
MRATLLSLLLALTSAPALAQQAPAASGEGAEGEDGEAGEATEEAPQPGADLYTQRVQQGIQMLVSGDAAGATEAFEQAVALDGERPQAPYFLAEVQRLGGNLEPALEGFRRAAELAAGAEAPRWQARALQAVAMTLERMEGRIEDARSAWQEYIRFADAHQTVSHPQLGRARVQAVDMMNEQERVYVEVRERIAERERQAAEEEANDDGDDRRRRRRRRRRR